MKVSMVSVSRRALPPQLGQSTWTKSGTLASGDPPRLSCSVSGSSTGS